MPITVKETLHHAEKVRIGHAAAQMIKDGETVMLDSGTTRAEVARQIRFLKQRSLNVITNSLNIAMELANLPHVRLIVSDFATKRISYAANVVPDAGLIVVDPSAAMLTVQPSGASSSA